ncbi:unnamed protein product [Rotaria sordida]|uniref:Uncharacterized protein n=1 Tax=Rotaria sordida TaxID=392033 RepID=A0A815D5A5_9BILA|nr:unnamed protein product [Rotaria sordida]CAF3912046.1 unnamed protein product [Rotaria sordida]
MDEFLRISDLFLDYIFTYTQQLSFANSVSCNYNQLLYYNKNRDPDNNGGDSSGRKSKTSSSSSSIQMMANERRQRVAR